MSQDDIARDKAAIAELIARYNYAIDHEDYQGWANTFAPDGVFHGIIGKFAAQRSSTNLLRVSRLDRNLA